MKLQIKSLQIKISAFFQRIFSILFSRTFEVTRKRTSTSRWRHNVNVGDRPFRSFRASITRHTTKTKTKNRFVYECCKNAKCERQEKKYLCCVLRLKRVMRLQVGIKTLCGVATCCLHMHLLPRITF